MLPFGFQSMTRDEIILVLRLVMVSDTFDFDDSSIRDDFEELTQILQNNLKRVSPNESLDV